MSRSESAAERKQRSGSCGRPPSHADSSERERAPSSPVRESQRPGRRGAVQAVVDLGLLVVAAGFRGEEPRGRALVAQQRGLDCKGGGESMNWARPQPQPQPTLTALPILHQM